MNEKEYLKLLFDKLVQGKLSGEELDIFLDLSEKHNKYFEELLAGRWETTGTDRIHPLQVEKTRTPIVRLLLSRVAVLMLGLSVLSVIAFYYLRQPGTEVSDLADTHVLSEDNTMENGTIEVSGVKDKIVLTDTASYIAQEILAGIVQNAGVDTIVVRSGLRQGLVYTLSDGTKIKLNQNSSLTYYSSYDRDNRTVSLNGEAFFDVHRNKDLPFVVKTGNGDIEVLGTSFSINNASRNKLAVYLKEGRVRYKNRDKEEYMTPGQYLTYDLGRDVLQVTQAEELEAMDWYYDLFYFNHASIHDVMAKLATYYGFELVDRTSGHKGSYSGTISRKESLENVIKILELTKTVKLDKERRIIIINP